MAGVAFVVLAAGRGARFGGATPKQFRKFQGRSLLGRTLDKLSKAKWIDEVVVALPRAYLKSKAVFKIPESIKVKTRFVIGGPTRFKSLVSVLRVLGKPEFVFVHDAARPNWNLGDARAMLRVLKKSKTASAVIPLLKIRETVKRVNSKVQTLPNREELFVSQTPQLVRLKDFMKAIKKAGGREDFVDEAQVLENAGLKVLPFPGNPHNIKVTYPEDLRLCQIPLLRNLPRESSGGTSCRITLGCCSAERNSILPMGSEIPHFSVQGLSKYKAFSSAEFGIMRVGLGFDLHRIKKNKNGFMILGGLKIKAPFRVIAHSDGDLLLHALSDAILSALGLDDIGARFAPGQSRTRAMDSRLILSDALLEVKKRRSKIANVSVVVAIEEPKMATYRSKIRASLAKMLGLPGERVGITFKTFEGLPGLSNRAIVCWVNCLIA